MRYSSELTESENELDSLLVTTSPLVLTAVLQEIGSPPKKRSLDVPFRMALDRVIGRVSDQFAALSGVALRRLPSPKGVAGSSLLHRLSFNSSAILGWGM